MKEELYEEFSLGYKRDFKSIAVNITEGLGSKTSAADIFGAGSSVTCRCNVFN